MKRKKAKQKMLKIQKDRLHSILLVYFITGILIGVSLFLFINSIKVQELTEYDNLKATIEDLGDWQCLGKEPTHCPTFNLKMKLKERGIETLNECMIVDDERIFWLSITLDGEEYYIDTMTGILFRPQYSYYNPIDWNECIEKGSLIG